EPPWRVRGADEPEPCPPRPLRAWPPRAASPLRPPERAESLPDAVAGRPGRSRWPDPPRCPAPPSERAARLRCALAPCERPPPCCCTGAALGVTWGATSPTRATTASDLGLPRCA